VELDVGHALVLGPGDGEKALLDELTVSEGHAGSGTRPHVHRAHVDVFYVLDGVLGFAGKQLEAGDLGYALPNVVHWFDPGDARSLNVHAPGAAYKQRSLARREGRKVSGEVIDTFDPPHDGGEPIVVARSEGEVLANDVRTAWIKIARPELCLFEVEAARGFEGPPPHLHRAHVDAFYVLEGSLAFLLDRDTVRADAGMFVAAPPGVVHTFANAGDDRVRYLNLHAPGVRFDEYMRRMDAGEHGRAFQESFDVFEVNDE
jgi:quercetin dioxygenase-like cupin family protein